MSKHYGDIPCVNLNGVIHITAGASKCACTKEWIYGHKSRGGKFKNIIWRNKEAVTCPDCLAWLAENETRIVFTMESCITYKTMPMWGKRLRSSRVYPQHEE